MNTSIVCMSPNFQRDATVCHYWKQNVQILTGCSYSVCCYFKTANIESPTTSNLPFPIITSGLSWEIVMMLLVQALHLKDGSAFNFPLILEHLL